VPHDITPSPAEFQRFICVLEGRNQKLSIENWQLKREHQTSKDQVFSKANIISWQQRMVTLGEEHVRLLEHLMVNLQEQPFHPNIAESEQMVPCQPPR
ncbi:hypothetical protein EDB80DRAFT_548749, partial [Ilyonectria destructans]